ncbi:TetR/AcrR family transcriptional regulator [Caviibacterium pharyngocola]|uniref:TetR family transcriptional regulator n=1 Tax=Caviibacterium pharyngocola TaxID=28159 RepID=A0A2M8RYD8_9PAST|nr:TetR/AcrR family transcriptional regulator [Caviibacterium pharyngocola]PJG83896.1 TetR family transcriptional regulator [Caviibacterium pharyngocola]
MRQSELDMTAQIFAATERLMAEGGLHNLSMHKIARAANISAGTIYIYFKNKDELLMQFAQYVFSQFTQAIERNRDETRPYFEQYRQIWWNIWLFLKDNPMIVVNLNQYQSLPHFYEVCMELEPQSYWNRFCQNAIKDQVICDLPSHILFSLGLKSAVHLSVDCHFFKQQLSDEMLEDVIARTWRAIQK